MATANKNTKRSVKSGAKIVASKGKFSLSSLQKKLIAIVAVVVLGAGGFWLYNDLQDGQLFAASCAASTYKQGSKSSCVKYAQILINESGAISKQTKTDGNFTSSTKKDVTAFQKVNKIKTSGIIDRATWKILCKVSGLIADAAQTNAGCAGWKNVISRNTTAWSGDNGKKDHAYVAIYACKKGGLVRAKTVVTDVIGAYINGRMWTTLGEIPSNMANSDKVKQIAYTSDLTNNKAVKAGSVAYSNTATPTTTWIRISGGVWKSNGGQGSGSASTDIKVASLPACQNSLK